MCKRNLFMIGTPYQLLCAIQIAVSLAGEENYFLLLSTTPSLQEIDQKLKESKFTFVKKSCFFDIYKVFDEQIGVGNKNSLKWRLKGASYLFGSKFRKSIPIDFSAGFDRFFSIRADYSTHAIFTAARKYNKDLQWHLFEDGLGSYTEEILYIDAIMHIENIFSRFLPFSLFKYYSGKWLRHPNLARFAGTRKSFKINEIKSSPIATSAIMELYHTDSDISYGDRIIFFESGFWADSENSSTPAIQAQVDAEFRCIQLLAKFHADSLIVKLHPRTVKDRFTPLGITVDKSSMIPWEAILLGQEVKNAIFVSMYTSAMINGILASDPESGNKNIFLYRLMPDGVLKTRAEEFFRSFKLGSASQIVIPNSEAELEQIYKDI